MTWVGVLKDLEDIKDAKHDSQTFQDDHWLRIADLVEYERKRKSKQVQDNKKNLDPCNDVICSFRNSNLLKIAQVVLTVL